MGTGGAVPTLRRNLPAMALQREGEILLFDCGEATQIQLIKAKLSLSRLEKIFVTHLHGDHLTGLPGLLMTLTHLWRRRPIYVYGPPGIKEYVSLSQSCLGYRLEYEVVVRELEGGEVAEGAEYRVECRSVEHNIFTLAYALMERERPGRFDLKKAQSLGIPEGPLFSQLQSGKEVRLPDGRVIQPRDVLGIPRRGRKVVYAVDTHPCKAVMELATEADVLVHDGMFTEDLREEAAARGHSTAAQAAQVAKEARVDRLVLTHISPRYEDEGALLQEAQRVFPRVVVARDLMEINIPVHK